MSICTFIECEQGSEEWVKARLAKCTSSRIEDVTKRGVGGGPSASLETYLVELVCEHLTQKPCDDIKAKPLEWGNENEPQARATYTLRSGNVVEQAGFATWNENPFFGCSVDGLIGKEGLIEIKCPYRSVNHLKTFIRGTAPSEYIPQIQSQLLFTGRMWTHFVSFDPRMPKEQRITAIEVRRDEDYIQNKLRPKLDLAYERFQELLELVSQSSE